VVDLSSYTNVRATNGSIVDAYHYLPFGELLQGGTYTSHKFTGFERDSETNLDFAKARHLGSVMGRFLSPDPHNAGAIATSPQTWNAYVYVSNNPLTLVDPTGMISQDADLDPNAGSGQDIFADGASEQSGVYAEDESRTQQEAPQQQAANTQASVQQQSVSQSSVGIMALPIIGRAIAGLEGGAEAGAITGTIEPRAGNVVGAVVGAVVGTVAAVAAPSAFAKTKDALETAGRHFDTAVDHLTSSIKMGGPDKDPRRGWKATVERSANRMGNNKLADIIHFGADMLRGTLPYQ
jgi:RHS repeat-associated protein